MKKKSLSTHLRWEPWRCRWGLLLHCRLISGSDVPHDIPSHSTNGTHNVSHIADNIANITDIADNVAYIADDIAHCRHVTYLL